MREFDEINQKLERIQRNINEARAVIVVVWMIVITAILSIIVVFAHI